MRGEADAIIQPRQAERAADARRQPRVGRRQARPDALIEPGKDHEVRLLQPRFQQTEDLQARMATLRRAHGGRAQDLRQHGGEARRIGRARAMDGGRLGVAQRLRGGMALMACPDALIGKPGGCLPDRREEIAQRLLAREGRLDGRQHGGDGRPPVAQARLPRAVLRQQRADARQPRRRARSAQQQVERADMLQPAQPLLAGHHQRMLEQRQQRHRRELLRARLRQRQQQRAGRKLRQRPAGGIVRIDAPALEMRGDARGQVAVRRHQRRGAPRRLDRLAQRDGDGLRFLGGVRSLDRAHILERALRRRHVRPDAGEQWRQQRIADRLAPRGAGIMLAAPAPERDFIAMHVHPLQQQLERELGMRFLRWRGQGCARLGRLDRADRLPLLGRQIEVEIGQHHHASRQPRHAAQQAGHRRRVRDDPRCDDKAPRRRLTPARRDMIEQAIASLRHVYAATCCQCALPGVRQRLEFAKGLLPVRGLIIGLERLEIARPLALDRELIERQRQRRRQPPGLTNLQPLARPRPLLAHQPRQDHQPLRRGNSGGNVRLRSDRRQRIAQRLIQVDIAHRHEARQQQAIAGRAHKGIAHRADRAIIRQEDDAARQRQPAILAAMLCQQPGGKRIGKRAVRGNGVEYGAAPVSHR